MATKYRVLGQALPANNTFFDMYAVPTGNSTIISTLNVCNLTVSNVSFRAMVRIANAAIVPRQYIAYDVAVPAQDSIGLTLGLTLDSTDVVTVFSNQGNVTFNLFGSEVY